MKRTDFPWVKSGMAAIVNCDWSTNTSYFKLGDVQIFLEMFCKQNWNLQKITIRFKDIENFHSRLFRMLQVLLKVFFLKVLILKLFLLNYILGNLNGYYLVSIIRHPKETNVIVQLDKALDICCQYDKILSGDFNSDSLEVCLDLFLYKHDFKNLVKKKMFPKCV